MEPEYLIAFKYSNSIILRLAGLKFSEDVAFQSFPKESPGRVIDIDGFVGFWFLTAKRLL